MLEKRQKHHNYSSPTQERPPIVSRDIILGHLYPLYVLVADRLRIAGIADIEVRVSKIQKTPLGETIPHSSRFVAIEGVGQPETWEPYHDALWRTKKIYEEKKALGLDWQDSIRGAVLLELDRIIEEKQSPRR